MMWLSFGTCACACASLVISQESAPCSASASRSASGSPPFPPRPGQSSASASRSALGTRSASETRSASATRSAMPEALAARGRQSSCQRRASSASAAWSAGSPHRVAASSVSRESHPGRHGNLRSSAHWLWAVVQASPGGPLRCCGPPMTEGCRRSYHTQDSGTMAESDHLARNDNDPATWHRSRMSHHTRDTRSLDPSPRQVARGQQQRDGKQIIFPAGAKTTGREQKPRLRGRHEDTKRLASISIPFVAAWHIRCLSCCYIVYIISPSDVYHVYYS